MFEIARATVARHARRLLLAAPLAAATVMGCAHATPISAAPVAPEEASRLEAAIAGTCEVTATQKEGGARKDAKGLKWTFGPDGQGMFDVPGGMTFGNKFSYHVDGRNILMDGTYKAFRVDDYATPTLKLFLYDISETYYCTKT